jgi:hypothetical protein
VTTNSDEFSVTINIAKGAAGRAIDAIVRSKVKSVGTRKARKEKKEREEDVATSGEQLAKMAKVTSGALASRGHYCLDADLYQQVLESHMGKQAAAVVAEVNRGVREDSRKEKALAAWTKRRQCTRGDMPMAMLKVLIQDMKIRKLDSPLRKVRVHGNPERSVVEAQCKDREVHLVKEKHGTGDQLTHYNLHVLLEVEGVGPETSLLPRTEDNLAAELYLLRNIVNTNEHAENGIEGRA